MKSQIALVALGLVLATAAIGFGIVGRLPLFNSLEVTPVRPDESTGAGVPLRIDCFIGMKGEPGSLYRGWICAEREPAPNLTP